MWMNPTAQFCYQEMMSTMVIVILVLQTLFLPASAIPLPCSLQWKSIDAYTPVAKDWVPANLHPKLDTPTEFLVRVQTTSSRKPGKHLVLSMQPTFNQKQMALVSMPAQVDAMQEFKDDDVKIFQSYDILTNPYECKLSWERCQFSGKIFGIQKSAYHVKVAPEDETYVAKTSGGSETTGNVGGDRVVLAVVGNKDSYDRSFGCLQSEKGGAVSFTQFELEKNEEDDISESMLGLDRIDNQSEATITHTVDHRKKFSETFIFTESHSWEHLKTWSLDIDISKEFVIPTTPPIPAKVEVKLGWEHEKKEAGETINSTSFTKEREVISSRSVMLEPYSSVQACSISSFENKLKLNYRAKARHTAPNGTNVEDVETMLKDVGYEKLKTEGSSVIVEMKGELEGSLAMHSTFVVTELAGDLTCEGLDKKFRKRDELRSRIKYGDPDALSELTQVENDILRIKNGPRDTTN
ncbi:unnamed protein product [Allacma fusca]|uniref:Uncharacterized protein n=1 Tax=Allacma fusca TaxID=39272 RepID=A0A8J2NQC4_9HEXA|nr:unnamed protein product [Allacma fusca]